MNWPYFVMGALLIGAYGLMWYMRVRRTRRIERDIADEARVQRERNRAAGGGNGRQLPDDVTREDIQRNT